MGGRRMSDMVIPSSGSARCEAAGARASVFHQFTFDVYSRPSQRKELPMQLTAVFPQGSGRIHRLR